MPRYSWLVQCTEIGQQLTPRSNGSNNATSGDRASRTEPCLAVFDSDERVLVLRSAASQDYHREFNVSTVEVRELRQPAPGVNNPALSVVCIRWNSGWILVQSHAKQQHGELLACLREGGGRQGNRISPAVIRARVQGAVTGLKHGANNRLSIFTLTLAHDRLSVSFQRSSASKTAFSWRYVDVTGIQSSHGESCRVQFRDGSCVSFRARKHQLEEGHVTHSGEQAKAKGIFFDVLDPTAVEAGEEWSYIVGLITARIRVAPLEFQEAQQKLPTPHPAAVYSTPAASMRSPSDRPRAKRSVRALTSSAGQRSVSDNPRPKKGAVGLHAPAAEKPGAGKMTPKTNAATTGQQVSADLTRAKSGRTDRATPTRSGHIPADVPAAKGGGGTDQATPTRSHRIPTDVPAPKGGGMADNATTTNQTTANSLGTSMHGFLQFIQDFSSSPLHSILKNEDATSPRKMTKIFLK